MKKNLLFVTFLLTLSACGTVTIPTLPANNAPAANMDINATQQSMNATQQSLIATNQALMAAQGVMETQNALLQMQASTNATETALASAMVQPATPTTYLLPVVETATSTPEPNLLFSDDFESGISSNWQQFGTWMVTDGQPVVVANNPTYYKNGNGGFNEARIILPSTVQLDNFALELEFGSDDYCAGIKILLSYRDENNYKLINISCSEYYRKIAAQGFIFFNNEKQLSIPDSSNKEGIYNSPTNHVRIEVRSTSLKLYINEKIIYDFINLPDSVTGTVGIAASQNSPVFDNFKIYQLP